MVVVVVVMDCQSLLQNETNFTIGRVSGALLC